MAIIIRPTSGGSLDTVLIHAPIEDAERHIRAGYPSLVPLLEAGRLVIVEGDRLPEPTPEEIEASEGIKAARVAAAQAEAAAIAEHEDLLRKILTVFLDHENRIRALENKAPVTRAQLVARVRSL